MAQTDKSNKPNWRVTIVIVDDPFQETTQEQRQAVARWYQESVRKNMAHDIEVGRTKIVDHDPYLEILREVGDG